MRPRRRLWTQRSTQAPDRARANEASNWWKSTVGIATILSHLSQVGLLIVAIIVYFYTVVPIYEKSVLDEEIAKRNIELKQLNATVASSLEEANQARRDASAAKVELAASLAQAEEVRKRLLSADERARRLYSELRTYVASRLVADLSSVCATPSGGIDLLIKESLNRPRTVKVTDNLLSICVQRQFKTADIQKALAKLSNADRGSLVQLVGKACTDAGPEVAAFLRAALEREKKRREEARSRGLAIPEVADDEIPVTSLVLAFSFLDLKAGIAAMTTGKGLEELRKRDVQYADITKKALFRALEQFLKSSRLP